MSAGDDNFFARWSRRKQAVRSAEAPTADEEKHAAEVAPAEEVAEDSDLQPPEAEPTAVEPPEPLPRLEDLTATSDLSAFLRKGVPGALKNAALRKMWSLDPAIRDYIGPADYAWDFNQPGSMAGFGPLEANKSVVEFLSKVGDAIPADSDDATAASEVPAAPPSAPQVTAAASDQAATASPDGPADASSPDEPAQPPQRPANPRSSPSADRVTVATSAPAGKTGQAEPPQISPPRRHGGAVPH